MNSVLAALLGGAGAGASTYGNLRFREQEQQRQNAQRMSELQQQEQTRRAILGEQAEANERLRRQAREAGANSIKALFPDFEAPEGDFDASVVMRGMIDRETTNRANAANNTRLDALDRSLSGRLDQIEKQGGISRSIADMNNTTRMAIAGMMEAGRRDRASASQPPADTRRPMTASIGKELAETGDVAALIRDAKTAMMAPEAKGAVGLKYNLANILTPAPLEGRVQSMLDGGAGNSVRARLGNLWSTVGKLRSGGAITDAEFKRLEPFLPSPSDDYDKAVSKLNDLESAYMDVIQRKSDIYGETYRLPPLDVLTGQRGASQQAPKPNLPPLSDADRRRAASDPKFAAWLRSKGYR